MQQIIDGDRRLTRPARPVAARQRRSVSRTLRLFAVDAAMAAVFVAVMNVPLTGVPVHEWLGLAIAAAVITHLVQHTNWIVTTTKRMFGASSFRNRVNYVMMVALFAAFVTVIASGLMISEAVLPSLGVVPAGSTFWLWLHLASVVWVLWLTGLHIALNWKWIVSTAKRQFSRSGARSSLRPARPKPAGAGMSLINRTLTVGSFAVSVVLVWTWVAQTEWAGTRSALGVGEGFEDPLDSIIKVTGVLLVMVAVTGLTQEGFAFIRARLWGDRNPGPARVRSPRPSPRPAIDSPPDWTAHRP